MENQQPITHRRRDIPRCNWQLCVDIFAQIGTFHGSTDSWDTLQNHINSQISVKILNLWANMYRKSSVKGAFDWSNLAALDPKRAGRAAWATTCAILCIVVLYWTANIGVSCIASSGHELRGDQGSPRSLWLKGRTTRAGEFFYEP